MALFSQRRDMTGLLALCHKCHSLIGCTIHIDSMLSCVCLVIDCRWHQNAVRTKKMTTNSATSRLGQIHDLSAGVRKLEWSVQNVPLRATGTLVSKPQLWCNIIYDEQLLLLYEEFLLKNPDFSYANCDRLDLNNIATYFKFIDLKKNLKIGLSSVGKMYVVCALLRNALTCLCGSQTSTFLELDPPSLQQYFVWTVHNSISCGVHLRSSGKSESDPIQMYYCFLSLGVLQTYVNSISLEKIPEFPSRIVLGFYLDFHDYPNLEKLQFIQFWFIIWIWK